MCGDVRLDHEHRKDKFYNKRSDGSLETNKLPKRHSVMIKEVDPLTRIERLSSYYKGLKLSRNWIKNRMSITRGTTTKL